MVFFDPGIKDLEIYINSFLELTTTLGKFKFL